MINKQTIETQLECKATAALKQSIAEDLKKEDAPLKDLLDNGTEDCNKTSN